MTTQPPTPEETKRLLERLKELHEKATEGQWRLCDPDEHPWRIGPIEPERQNTVTIVNEHGYGIMCFPSEIGSGHTRDFEFAIEVHNAFPLLLSLAQRAEAAEAELKVNKDSLDGIASYIEPHYLGAGEKSSNPWLFNEIVHRGDKMEDLYDERSVLQSQLTSLQAENGRKDQLLASLGDLLKECAEKLDRYANRQTAKRALPQGGFADNKASEGQHYAQIQSLIDRARNWRKALTPPPDAMDGAPYCQYCGAKEKRFCKCGPIAKNH